MVNLWLKIVNFFLCDPFFLQSYGSIVKFTEGFSFSLFNSFIDWIHLVYNYKAMKAKHSFLFKKVQNKTKHKLKFNFISVKWYFVWIENQNNVNFGHFNRKGNRVDWKLSHWLNYKFHLGNLSIFESFMKRRKKNRDTKGHYEFSMNLMPRFSSKFIQDLGCLLMCERDLMPKFNSITKKFNAWV